MKDSKISSKRTVLIIDDVDEMREMLTTLVDGLSNYRVSAACGNCAEARVEAMRRRPSLVLMDEILPGESSFDLLQEFVADGLPVILMTGVENPTHEVPAGAALRVEKPGWKSLDVDAGRLEAVFNQVLGLS
jgi:DNA-binding NtrC family response regulator